MSPVIKWIGPAAVSLVSLVCAVDGLRLYTAGLTSPLWFWLRSAWLVAFVYAWMRRELALQKALGAMAELLAALAATKPRTAVKGD